MRKIFMSFVALLAIAAAATGSARAQSTSSLVFEAKCNGSGTANDGVQWTVTSDGAESNFDNNRGIHYGTGSATVGYIELSTSGITGTITQVKVNASTASGVTATVSVTVGGNAFGTTQSMSSNDPTDYTFTGSASGAIVVRVAKPSAATKALYVNSIEVTYTPASSGGGSTPEPPAPAVTHNVRLAEGTEDATSWQGKAGEGEYQALPLEGVAAGTAVTVKYNGTMKVKSVKAVKPVAPLTMEALTAGNIQVTMTGTLTTGMKYSVNGGAKTPITTTTTINVAAGDKVQFYGNGTSTQAYGGDPQVKLLGTAQTKVYGNIMSLLDEDNFATLTALPDEVNVFKGLFVDNATLTDASGLLLPATTLTNSCYNMMFYNCSALTAAPALPATTLADKCYQNMFYGCTALTTAPALPATTLAEDCYNSMFQSSGLTAAPALPATTLAIRCYNAMFRSCNNLATAPSLPAAVLPEGCYMHMFRESGLVTVPANMMASATTMGQHCCESMFRECPNLTNAPTIAATTVNDYSLNAMFYHSANVATADFTLPATTLADHCYYNMFNGCTALTTAPELPATTLAGSCYQNMFKGCSSLTTAPVLTATTLAEGCYASMFEGCSNLNSVTCLATDNNASNCTSNWLYGVATTGTFYAISSTNWTTNSPSGIPTGWTRVDPNAIVPLTMEALTAGNIQVNMGSGTLTTGMKYSVNGGAKNLINTTTTIDVAAGDKVQFYGNGTSTQVYGGDPQVKLLGTAQTKVYGNIMSLLDEDNFATLTALPNQDYVFTGLFKDNANLTDARGLLLPATTLAQACYKQMFWNCTGLTAAPALPATTLAQGCYQSMFYNCFTLVAAPALPATELANNCYNSMFSNCSTLVAAPALPATTLANNCYNAMFNGCSSLTTAPVLPAPTLADNCYGYMFYGCSSLNSVTCLATDVTATDCTKNWLKNVAATGTFTTPASTGWTTNSASGIPSGWGRVNADVQP